MSQFYAPPMNRDEYWRVFDSYSHAPNEVARAACRNLHHRMYAQWVGRALVARIRADKVMMDMLRACPDSDWAFNSADRPHGWWDERASAVDHRGEHTRLCAYKEACRIARNGDDSAIQDVPEYSP
jgi:hypothetical protein